MVLSQLTCAITMLESFPSWKQMMLIWITTLLEDASIMCISTYCFHPLLKHFNKFKKYKGYFSKNNSKSINVVFSFLTHREILSPCVVYLSPEVTKFFSFTVWKFGKDMHMILQPIPKLLFSQLADEKKDFWSKFASDFQKTVVKR